MPSNAKLTPSAGRNDPLSLGRQHLACRCRCQSRPYRRDGRKLPAGETDGGRCAVRRARTVSIEVGIAGPGIVRPQYAAHGVPGSEIETAGDDGQPRLAQSFLTTSPRR